MHMNPSCIIYFNDPCEIEALKVERNSFSNDHSLGFECVVSRSMCSSISYPIQPNLIESKSIYSELGQAVYSNEQQGYHIHKEKSQFNVFKRIAIKAEYKKKRIGFENESNYLLYGSNKIFYFFL